MPDLLHEYWESEDGGQFCSVRESADQERANLLPHARYVFSLLAPSWHRAMQIYQERLGYGDYVPEPGWLDHFYTEEKKQVQEAYLKMRDVR